jgi:hypothetical protein
MKSDKNYDEIASGMPVKKDQRLTRLRKDYGFVDRNGQEYKSFMEMTKSTAPPKMKTADMRRSVEDQTSRWINQDQKINYMVLKEGKFKRTDTINQKYSKPRPKISQRQNPFTAVYSCNSETKFIWSDKPAPKVSTYNNSGSKYDILNTARPSVDPKRLDFETPKLFRKVNNSNFQVS